MAQGLGGLGRAIGTIIDVRRARRRREQRNEVVADLLAQASYKINNDPEFTYADFYMRAVRRGVADDPRVAEYGKIVQEAEKQNKVTQKQTAITDAARVAMQPTASERVAPSEQALAGVPPPRRQAWAETAGITTQESRPAPESREQYNRRFALETAKLSPDIAYQDVLQNPTVRAAQEGYPTESFYQRERGQADVQQRHQEMMQYREKRLREQHERWKAQVASTRNKDQRKNQDSNIKFIIRQQTQAKKREDEARKHVAQLRERLAKEKVKASDPTDLGEYEEAIDLYQQQIANAEKDVERLEREVDAWYEVGDTASGTGGAALSVQDIQAAFQKAMGTGFGRPATSGGGSTGAGGRPSMEELGL